jgi:hypothetical protein
LKNENLIKNKISIPNDFSFNELTNICLNNVKHLKSKVNDIDFTSDIIHVKTIQQYDSSFLPKSGSLVHFQSNNDSIDSNSLDISRNFGIILNDTSYSLTKPLTYQILLPDGTISQISIDQILFTLPSFLNYNLMKKLLPDNIHIIPENLIQLTYSLNIFLLFFAKISKNIISKDLIRTIYLKTSFINYQSSLNLELFALELYNESKSIRNLLNIKINPFGSHCLIFACHFLIYNDPIHFRFVNSKISIYNILNPLTQLSTKYFKNPIILAENLENIYIQPNELILKSYYDILSKSNHFQIFNILKTDENFKRLILLIKYSIVYQNLKINLKLKQLLPINEETLNPKILFEFLKDIGIYDKNSNPILSSGIYGFNISNPTDLSLNIKNINELQYSERKGLTIEELPKYLKGYNPIKYIGQNNNEKITKDKFSNKNYSDLFINMIKDSKDKIWPKLKTRNKRKLYKLTETIAFSVDQISLTNYKFNIFIPLPTQAPNENITILEPIQINNNIASFPKFEKFNNSLRINQPCFKITFNHNLIDSNSLTSPNIKVGLDVFKKIEEVDKEWFSNRNPSHLQGSKKKLECWLSLNKLLNMLVEKEKSRIRLGYLKTFGDSTEFNQNFLNFKKFFIDNKIQNRYNINNENLNNSNNNENLGSDLNLNLNLNIDNEIDNYVLKDKKWIVSNLSLLIDESLSKFCNDKGINIINRSLNKEILSSIDYRVFRKFKIFKWYANSYETFNFQLSSNPGDLTAFVSCLKFLGKFKYFVNYGNKMDKKQDKSYLPLGLKEFASFTSFNFIETHLNKWQLFRYLLVESFDMIEDKKGNIWDPKLLNKVTFEHFNKCISQNEGYIEIINRLNRFEILKQIEQQQKGKNLVSGGTDKIFNNLTIIKCIVTKITENKIYGYWFEMDIEVEIQTQFSKLTIGDRLLCSKIIEVDPLNDIVIIS